MRGPFPKTLRGQLVLVIFATFVVIQSISLWILAGERGIAVRNAQGLEAADRAANVVRLLDAAPAELRSDILRTANSPLVRFSLSASASVDHLDHDVSGVFTQRIRALLDDDSERQIRVELHQINETQTGTSQSPDIQRMHDVMMGSALASVEMQIAIVLKDGSWLNVSTRFHNPPVEWPWESILGFGIASLIIAAAVWITLSQLTEPIRKLADSAEKLGRGEGLTALPEAGPNELRRLNIAFNEMQRRLTRFISERTRLLAALGHDLRSPLTALRVQAEMVDEIETRERLVAIIAEMQEMAESTLSFARGMVTSEATKPVDFSDFLHDLTAELIALGGAITLKAEPGLDVRLKPVAMRRALRNVIENALRYGQKADILAKRLGNSILIRITDKGAGIPQADLERVFDPFVRVEKSRNLETGGSGLGLSIARTIIHAHGGEINLSNLINGGLQVEITLPFVSSEEKFDVQHEGGASEDG